MNSWKIAIEKFLNKYKKWKEVKNRIKKLGGTMTRNFPTPNRSLKELEKDNKKIQIK